ncbi:D-2-hydroxyacid dehydrogenase [Halobium salinum]|uniref:D-2-hydroxyacid dehydrogenase n=1 Tax=Halobium salinum TaxID=1364940 RepID=A0ABD5PDZ6_9EURY|nr:D-2-hydroxyacid dehydrogenase [Halobium salinum]
MSDAADQRPDADVDSERDPDVVVLRKKIHGLPSERYAEALRERLPDREVAFAATPEQERELVARAPVVTGHYLAPERIAEAENLDYFACIYAGTGHLPMEEFESRGVAVTNASGVHGPNIAEHAIGAMLAFARDFPRAFRRKERREWRSFPTHELMDSTVAVVGLGAIGQATVERLDAFGVHTVGVRHSPEKGGPTDEVYGFDELHSAVVDADYTVLACPLTDETEGLVGDGAFQTMPTDAVLVNVARGKVVDTDALVSALRGNDIRGAALDVTDPEPLPEDHELWGFDNVLVTPHNAGHTPEYFERMADILVRNLELAEERGAFEGLENQVT